MVRFKICPLATCDTTYVCVDKQLEERGCCSKLFKVQLSLANFDLFLSGWKCCSMEVRKRLKDIHFKMD